MNIRFLPGMVCALCACLPAFIQAADSAVATDTPLPASGTGDVQATPPISFQVLRQWRVNAGDHTVILKRVVPPELPPAPPPPKTPTTEELAAAEAFEARQPMKKSVVLFLSATVYDRQVTDVRWFNALGEHRIYSNIDFNLVAGMGRFETPDTSYTLLMGLGNDNRAERIEYNRSLTKEDLQNDLQLDVPPPPTEFSPVRAEYIVAEDRGHKPLTAEDLAALEALHVFFDANKQQLAENYSQREKANAERQRWLKEHPPAPKDIVIHYWRKPSERPKAEGTK